MDERREEIVRKFAERIGTFSLRERLEASLWLIDKQPSVEQLEAALGIPAKKPPGNVVSIQAGRKTS